jgi:uncharacterized sporulation protein YeaH/YhbH (DUF444 family)
VEALIKEKEKDNVLIYLELVNLKSASLLDFEELRRTTKAKKKKGWWTQLKSIRGICNSCRRGWRLQMNKRRIWT